MYKDIEINYGVQVIFSTIPNQGKKEFESEIEESYFSEYCDAIKYNNNFLYKPLKFYLFGDYDICYITLIDNFKFSHRLFEAKIKDVDSFYDTHTFQSFIGLALNEKDILKEMFSSKSSEYFVNIINLKLNNGLLIGNGIEYIETVRNKIAEILGDTKYLLIQTFSWFELSLVVLLNDTRSIANIILDLRNLEFKQIKTDSLLNNSLYFSLFKTDNERIQLDNTNVFSDTHTYFGLNEKLINENLDTIYVKEFKLRSKDFKLYTEIEWHIKPGHLDSINLFLQKDKDLKTFYNNSIRRLILGKSDYLIQEKDGNILFNFYLFRMLSNDKNKTKKLFKHIRKIRSFVFLDSKEFNNRKKNIKKNPLTWDSKLKPLIVKNADFKQVNKHLKSLKISRQIRSKILKLFSNYNNGIQDPILFPFFMDFKVFIVNLINYINSEFEKSQKTLTEIRTIESHLNKRIDIFQDGYNVRFLNGYQFENISNFNLGFNSSIQLLLTSYWSIVYEYGKLFYDNSNYSPIIQLNYIDTVSTEFSINYSIHHLTSPEFIAATLLKELLNKLEFANDKYEQMKEKFNSDLKTILHEINESYLDEIFNSELFDLNSFIIDLVRFGATFNLDFNLLKHWLWSYSFQNSSLYNSTGMFNEHRLQLELFRVILIRDFYEIDDDMLCPSPSLFTYWDRHYIKLQFVSKRLIEKIKSNSSYISSFSKFILEKYLSKFDEFNKLDFNVESITYYENITNFSGISGFVDLKLLRNKIKFLFDKNMNNTNDIYQIDKLLYNILEKYYILNNKEITILNRDWKSGCIIPEYNNLSNDRLFAIDQTGGVFFYSEEKTNIYFKQNAEYLLQIIDFAYKQKKSFFLDNS